MKFAGIWPEERKWNRPSSYMVLIPFLTMLCFATGPQTIDLSLIANDLNLVVENLSMANMTMTVSLVKTMTFWMNGKSLKSLLKFMAKDWTIVETQTERETMVNSARITRKTTMRCTIMCQLVLVCYVILRLCSNNQNKLLFRGYFPYNISVSPNYELTVIGQIMAATYAAAMYTSVDTFVAMLVLHVCGQLSNLKDDLRNIHLHDKTVLQTKLKKIVQKHDYINRFAETIENCFNMMLLIQILGCTIQLCFQSFQAIMSFEEEAERYMIFQIAFLCIYIIYVMVQLYLYCYVGEKLTVESIDIADTAYHCEWYNLPPKDAGLLIIIMCRATSSPLKLTAGKFCCFTILLYSQILKTSVSYISVLYATKG
ncbi:hypothetical protein QLX08_001094 [Tetragonisca angustula]|uniref:Odorant receptor n=1 Tax=Tetragonisca angustula TaxID=166442 RepID=A0AAW1AGI5_9HYME